MVRSKRRNRRRPHSYSDAVEAGITTPHQSDLYVKTITREDRDNFSTKPSYPRNRHAIKGFQKSSNFLIGTRKDDHGIPVVQRRMSAFISRLGPDTTVEILNNYIKNYMNIADFCCERLNTRFNTYSSFCVSTTETHFQSLMNADSWPEGVLVRKFFQRRN